MRISFRSAVLLPLAIAVITGCNSKKETTGSSPATPQEKSAAGAPAQNKGVSSPVVPPQDKADAAAVGARVLTQFEAGNFINIYREASPAFKQLGTEEQFVAKFSQTRQRVGALSNPKEISATVRPDKSLVLIYRMENDRYKSDVRLSFTRGEGRVMRLAGMNQHDEPKK